MGLRYLEITGGNPLCGEITVQGSKNAALPILAACLLGEGPCVIKNCPRISDIADLQILMHRLGCEVKREQDQLIFDNQNLCGCEINGAEAVRIRSSVLFLGALLGKMGKAVLPYPGGCAIGARPIDQHLMALERLGVRFSFQGERICAVCEKLHGSEITLDCPSVGATENVILTAVMAEGQTILRNAAQEPEIEELCAFLNQRGAKICRTQEGTIYICGVSSLHPVKWRLRSDRIVAGTYLLAVMAAGGSLHMHQVMSEDLNALFPILKKMGARLEYTKDSVKLEYPQGGSYRAIPYIETAPYPGFPTDLQSPLMAVLCRAAGRSVICETVFESRFRTAKELRKMGAEIQTEGRCACIYGHCCFRPAQVEAPDLRGGAALVIAALAANGTSRISNIEYIERGYEDICRDLNSLGAKMQKGEIHEEKDQEKKKTDSDRNVGAVCASCSRNSASVSGQRSQSIRK